MKIIAISKKAQVRHTIITDHFASELSFLLFIFVFFCYYITQYMFFFFFSSRRRHTRFSRDWSSDVCSSDLFPDPGRGDPLRPFRNGCDRGRCSRTAPRIAVHRLGAGHAGGGPDCRTSRCRTRLAHRAAETRSPGIRGQSTATDHHRARRGSRQWLNISVPSTRGQPAPASSCLTLPDACSPVSSRNTGRSAPSP